VGHKEEREPTKNQTLLLSQEAYQPKKKGERGGKPIKTPSPRRTLPCSDSPY